MMIGPQLAYLSLLCTFIYSSFYILIDERNYYIITKIMRQSATHTHAMFSVEYKYNSEVRCCLNMIIQPKVYL